ncbi:unnamed protein product [Pedinophyceae sp. YPF-701]|nr:unnamed protein product [Pedinophyceae sp. YPF-701]
MQSALLRAPCALPRRTQPARDRSVAAASHRRGFQRARAEPLTYKDAGVDIDAGNELVNRIKKLAPAIGGFSGLFPFGDSYLVAGTDGVGTKLKLAFAMNKHDTIGQDLVAMSVNDIIVTGARPLFFLDYFATSKLDVEQAEDVIRGIVKGCELAKCDLMGGETAEMPGFYEPGEYDLSGFAVGAVKKDRVIDGTSVKVGDVVLGLPSSGVHSNGFSLVRRILDRAGVQLSDPAPWGGQTFGEALLAPTIIYVDDLLRLHDEVGVKAAAHITGEGHPGNIPRVLPKGVTAKLDRASWTPPALFRWLQEAGDVSDQEMFRTFNMGIGMVLVIDPEEVTHAQQVLPHAKVVGQIVEGDSVIIS